MQRKRAERRGEGGRKGGIRMSAIIAIPSFRDDSRRFDGNGANDRSSVRRRLHLKCVSEERWPFQFCERHS